MKQSPELEIIQANMLPGTLSAHGFLGEDTRNLADILGADAKTLNQLGLSQEDLADKMQELTDCSMLGLGRPVNYSNRFEVESEDYMGKISCPFQDFVKVDKRETRVRRLDTGVMMRWTDLNVHMIREHGFFEGHGGKYRLDPLELARFLGLA